MRKMIAAVLAGTLLFSSAFAFTAFAATASAPDYTMQQVIEQIENALSGENPWEDLLAIRGEGRMGRGLWQRESREDTWRSRRLAESDASFDEQLNERLAMLEQFMYNPEFAIEEVISRSTCFSESGVNLEERLEQRLNRLEGIRN